MAISIWFLLPLLFVTDAQTKVCPPLFLRYSTSHSYCKPRSPTCNILQSSVLPEDMGVILAEHNKYRSKIATGQVQKLPPASDMMEMVWDDELAAVAQAHANQCKFEHDCSNCRRVQNFGVGQNLAIETVSGSPAVPRSNWPSAIKSWYDEIQYFDRSFINPYVPTSPASPTYGHFTQLVWASSWRVGCGYVVHNEGNTYNKLYVCNYGPAGNTIGKALYQQGPACQSCPVNSCCGKICNRKDTYPGLCKITDKQGPIYSVDPNRIFNCDFRKQNPDCDNYATGSNKWLKYETLSGNYVGIVLQGGESSTLVFKKTIKPKSASFCAVTSYRKGPNVDGQENANLVTETFSLPNFETTQNLPDFGGDFTQQFSDFSMALGWNMETQMKVTFSVPPGKPEQFLEIQSVYAYEGPCKQSK